MSSHIGYVVDGDVYCLNCCADECGAQWDNTNLVTDFDTFDYPVHCGECRVFIPTSLSHDGVKYLRQIYEQGMRDMHRWEEYIETWDFVDWYFIHTFAGPMDVLGNFLEFDV